MSRVGLHPLELAVLVKLTDDRHPVLGVLARQIPHLAVRSRELTGVGFFTDFVLREPVPRIRDLGTTVRLDHVFAEIDGLAHGASFVCTVVGGMIDMLEGFSFDEPWPHEINNFTLSVIDSRKDELIQTLAKCLAGTEEKS